MSNISQIQKIELCLTLKQPTCKDSIESSSSDKKPKKIIFNLDLLKKNYKNKKLINTKKSKSKSLTINQNDDLIEKPIKHTKTPKVKIPTVDKPKCLARIANGGQCHRSRISDDSVFCNCHKKHCPYGRIDGPLEGKFLSLPKKRGPKKTSTKEYQLEELDQNMYLSTQLVKIDSNLFLIDKFGILFTNDHDTEIVGRKIGDEIHWYR